MSSPFRRILIADDHEAIRRGVRVLVESRPNLRIVAEAATGREGDPGRSSLVAIGGSVVGTGTGMAQTTPIYGRVEPAGPPPSGQYSDFIVVTLSF